MKKSSKPNNIYYIGVKFQSITTKIIYEVVAIKGDEIRLKLSNTFKNINEGKLLASDSKYLDRVLKIGAWKKL